MDARDRHAAIDYSHLAAHIAGAIFVVFWAILVIWLIVATPKATAFDADGVRCYRAAWSMECVKTAEPAR